MFPPPQPLPSAPSTPLLQTLFGDFLEGSSLVLRTMTNWSSQSPDFRKKIHTDLKNNGTSQENSLKTRPETSSHSKQNTHSSLQTSYSISHCRQLGGYFGLIPPPLAVSSSSPIQFQIGFDLEELSRITPSVLKRLSRQNISRRPSTSSLLDQRLWGAKESTFKALRGPLQPPTLSHIDIEMSQKETGSKTFLPSTLGVFFLRGIRDKNIPPSLESQGWVLVQNDLLWSFCVLKIKK